MRFEVLKRDAEIACWKRIAAGGEREARRLELKRQLAELDEEFAFVAACVGRRVHGQVMPGTAAGDSGAHLAVRTTTASACRGRKRRARPECPPSRCPPPSCCWPTSRSTAFLMQTATCCRDNPWGFKLKVPEYKFDRGELHNLSVGRGTLTDEDRYTINHPSSRPS